MYVHTLESLMLARNKDMKKLMDVFSLYEEEQVLPKANVLRYAAKVLESAGEPVPFKVPVVCATYYFSYSDSDLDNLIEEALPPQICICGMIAIMHTTSARHGYPGTLAQNRYPGTQ